MMPGIHMPRLTIPISHEKTPAEGSAGV